MPTAGRLTALLLRNLILAHCNLQRHGLANAKKPRDRNPPTDSSLGASQFLWTKHPAFPLGCYSSLAPARAINPWATLPFPFSPEIPGPSLDLPARTSKRSAFAMAVALRTILELVGDWETVDVDHG